MCVFHGLLLLMGGVESNPGPSGNTGRSGGSLRLGFLNVRSASNKSAVIHDLIESERLDVLALCETWFQQTTPVAIKNDIAPPGFSVAHRYRACKKTKGRGIGSVKGGGGISLIYRDYIKITNIEHELNYGPHPPSDHTFESLAIRVEVGRARVNLIVVYRPPPAPDSGFFHQLSDLLDSADLLCADTIICGDFNCPGTSIREIDTRLERLIVDHNLVQFIKTSTRKLDGNVLDLVIAKQDGIITAPPTVKEVSFSDHNLVTFCSDTIRQSANAKSFTFRDIKTLDIQAFRATIRRSVIFLSPPLTVDDYAAQLRSDVVTALDNLAPIKRRTRRVGRPTARWMSDGARARKREARRLERIHRKTGKRDDYAAYRRAGRLASNSIRAARAAFYRDEFSTATKSTDLNGRWRLVKEVLHNDDRQPAASHEDADRLSRSFTTYFTNKLSTIAANIQATLQSKPPSPQYTQTPTTHSLMSVFPPATVSEVAALIKSIPGKSSPLDFVPTSVIKSCHDVFAPLITHLANRSFSQGKFPVSFKLAQVTPLLKKPGLDTFSPSNYRPISNLNTISKIVERLVLTRIRSHITTSPNFSPFQSAYRPNHSTETAILNITDKLFTSISHRRVSALCTIDLSSAFDTVSHSILADRLLSDFGLDGSVGDWLHSYTSGRSQFVKVGDSNGNITQLRSGVPQGSVLGPLLFSAYMSPISRLIERHNIHQHHYADDTTLFIELTASARTLPSQLIDCIDDLVDWCIRNDMQINPDKTELLLVGSARRLKDISLPSKAHIAGTHIGLHDSVKILGIIVDSTLSFDKHVSSVVQSCNYHIQALRHIRPLLSHDVACQIACSVIASRLDYCNSVLYNTSASNILRLQRVQNNLARVVCGSSARTNPAPLLQRLHWLPIEQRIKYKIATITFNVLQNDSPSYLRNCISQYQPSRTLRSSGNNLLSIPNTINQLSDSAKAFRCSAPAVWNSLSLSTRWAPSLDSFKSRLKTELFVNAVNVSLP